MFWFLSKTGFLCHSFGSRCARKPNKASKDSDHSLVSKKNLSQKTAHRIGAQGRVNLAKNTKTCSHYEVTQRKAQTKTKTTFFNQNYKTCRIRRCFEHLSSYIAWRVLAEIVQDIISSFAVLNRLRAGVGRFRSWVREWRMALFCGLWVWSRRSNRRRFYPPMSSPSTSPWTARPDDSGWWCNRLAAQHLPRNLVREAVDCNFSRSKEEKGRTRNQVQCQGWWRKVMKFHNWTIKFQDWF